jgi:hypothetical protein
MILKMAETNKQKMQEPEESSYDTSAAQATERGPNLQASERSEETEKHQTTQTEEDEEYQNEDIESLLENEKEAATPIA